MLCCAARAALVADDGHSIAAASTERYVGARLLVCVTTKTRELMCVVADNLQVCTRLTTVRCRQGNHMAVLMNDAAHECHMRQHGSRPAVGLQSTR